MPARSSTGPAAIAARAGRGSPLVLLHGFADSWRTWDLVRPALERRHDVLTLALPGHIGGPAAGADIGMDVLVGALERTLDDAGIAAAHLAGNSLGGFLALRLAARGRARSVVALAPAGGWPLGDSALGAVLDRQRALLAQAPHAARAAALLAGHADGRRRALGLVAERAAELPPELAVELIRAPGALAAGNAMLDAAARDGYELDAAAVDAPVRFVWGTADRLLPWPAAAIRFLRDWFPHADWIELDGAGHAPQLDAPLETAELIAGHAAAGA